MIPNCLNLRRAISGYRNPNSSGRPEPYTSFNQMGTLNNPLQLVSDGDEMDLDDEWALLRRLLIDNTSQWFLDRLDEPYPPLGAWVADNAQIAQTWEDQSKSLKRSVHLLQPERLLMTIHEHESAHICDTENNLVTFVWRHFCPDQSYIDSVLKSTAEARSTLLLVGDATGIDFSSSPDPGLASAMVTFWDLCRIWLPVEIISDIQSRCAYTNHPSNKQRPPSGCVSKNHSSAIVRGSQSPTWKVSWILNQTFNSHHGGSFYLSDYGLRVEAASNTLIAWKSSNAHGFGLFDLDQCRKGLLQSGLTIGSLKGLLANFQAS
ncbi:hypothetical protein M378DRAFT_20851 [Amanita muscaria Koide BX008]|uniref:Uncharacterized protein n=1 Tax=Amanita muscaria (strain Koide BX008) TaxID=946122 RepID=A0A0C2XLQ4_AMAMK|nr:hypothetical protein M378DRAFT_20851 [Amanita muscaria Koide BX008]